MAARSALRGLGCAAVLSKAPTGISGLDEITYGGLPRGRTTLVCGGTGSGKTMLGVEFLVRGAQQFGEPGVLMSFEETAVEVSANVASLGFDLPALERAKLLSIDHIRAQARELEEIGAYDLDGLFARLGLAIDEVGAKRVVLDTIEALFGLLSNERILRSEIRRLFRWLNDRGMTSIVTGERGDGQMTRYGLEEYVSDCVLLLDQRVDRQTTTRRLRVVKYRGSVHGGDEYPFIMTEHGFSVLPISSLGLQHAGSDERISTGMARLDGMLGGKGFYCGSSVLVSGNPGAGKTSVACQFVEAACRRGERALYLAYEESPDEIARNMQSIGIGLQQWIESGCLSLRAARPTSAGFEIHLARLHALAEEVLPTVVVIDPISAFRGPEDEVAALLARLVDFLKGRGITALMTSLVHDELTELAGHGISSVIDTWLMIRTVESNGERNRLIDVVKSRGIEHSNQVRELVISDRGLDLRDVYVGLDGIAVGSERIAREGARELLELDRSQTLERRHRALEQRRTAVQAQIAALQAELELASEEVRAACTAAAAQEQSEDATRVALGFSRSADRTPRPPRAASTATDRRR
ncbi:MAG: circadian clock protein KaiC [Solirubrobacteraceae bacterium]